MQEGKEYILLFSVILDEIKRLEVDVQQILDDKLYAHSVDQSLKTVTIPIVLESTVEPVLDGKFIIPKEIVSYAKKGKKILILDFRSNNKHLVAIPEPSTKNTDDTKLFENIVVAQCPPFCIERTITLSQLSKVIPIKERLKVNQIQKYDLVVLMDEDNPVTDRDNSYLPPANFLISALTVVSFFIKYT